MRDTSLYARLRARSELALSRPLALVPTALNRLLPGRPVVIDGQTLHPDAQSYLRSLPLLGLDRPHPEIEVERERHARGARLSHGRTIRVATVEEHPVAGAAGELRARLYVPERAPAAGPLLVYFHGGGFAVGGFATHDQLCRLLCREAGIRVLLVSYRLGPEHRFPAAHEDALAAYLDVAAAPERFGGSADTLAIGGDSAGANLALSVARALRQTSTPAPAFQALFYPVCDPTRERLSHELFGEGFYLTASGSPPGAPTTTARTRRSTRGSRRCSPTTSPGCRGRTCCSPDSTRCATRRSNSPSVCARPGTRSS